MKRHAWRTTSVAPNCLVPSYLVLSCLVLSCLVASTAVAKPVALAVQGTLRTTNGAPVADGDYALAFGLYSAKSGGNAVYLEKLAVKVQRGMFATVLGVDDPTKKLDHKLFVSGQAGFVGVRVGTDPELARVALQPVPLAVLAETARELACSGCVGGAHIAAGSIAGKHTGFVWAAGVTKGGSAKHALAADKANHAKLADVAANATNAQQAQTALQANSAKSAAGLKCTGCITAAHVEKGFVAGLQKAGQLAKVASSGKFADVSGPLGADLDFARKQALQFRFQNAAKAPAPCDKTTIGLAWYDTTTQTLKVCNGSQYHVFAQAAPFGSASQPGDSCKQIRDKVPGIKSGLAWLKLGGKAVQAWCDQDVAGGGWTLAAVVSSSDGNSWTHTSGNWENSTTIGPAGKPQDADYKGEAFAGLGASEVRIDYKGKLLLRTGACLSGTTLAAHFKSKGWTCGGSASLTSHPACANPCKLAESIAIAGEPSLTYGKKVSHLYFKAGEANGVQDSNKDRAYLSTSARTNIDTPNGLGSFCSGGCNGKAGDADLGTNHDGVNVPGKGHWYAIWLR